jgi:hypothetical protein
MLEFETAIREHIQELINGVKNEKERYATAFAAAARIADQYTQMAYENEPPEKEIVCKKGCEGCCTGARGTGLTVCEAEYVCLVELFGEAEPAKDACPFLKDHICTVYQYRPIACRAMNSYDIEWCGNPPLLFTVGPEGDSPIYHPQYQIVMATHRALCAALDQKPFRLKERIENGKPINQ